MPGVVGFSGSATPPCRSKALSLAQSSKWGTNPILFSWPPMGAGRHSSKTHRGLEDSSLCQRERKLWGRFGVARRGEVKRFQQERRSAGPAPFSAVLRVADEPP